MTDPSQPIDIEDDQDSKKRKTTREGATTTITNHFPVVARTPTSPPILKEGKYSNSNEDSTKDNPSNTVFMGSTLTYLYLMIDIPMDRNHVERYRIIVTKLLSEIRQADPEAVLVQYEATPRYVGTEIEIDANFCIDHPRKMPRSITQLQKYFPKGKPKKGGGTVYTNILILHKEDIEDMITDMKDGLEAYNPRIGKQRIQHYDVAKLGYIMCLLTKIETKRWAEFLKEQVEAILGIKVQLAISAAKINDGTGYSDTSQNKQTYNRNKKKKVEYWGIHVETTKEQQVSVKRAICEILATKIPSWMYGMELKFMPVLRYDMDSKNKQRLRNAMMKHKQVLANLSDFKLPDFEEIDSPISSLQGKTIRQLIMDLKTEKGETIFITVERNWQGEQVAWAKRLYKKEAELYSSHMAAWLVKLHGDGVIAKLDPATQALVKKVEWRNDIPLYPEEAEIEDAGEMKIDWLIDMKELETNADDDNSIILDDASIGSFGSHVYFSSTQPQNQNTSIQTDETLREQDDSIQRTTVAFAQSSQSVEGYGKPSALT
jgi:hypothetical protein